MFDRDKWLEILITMFKNPLRTLLTSVSVAVGIFILVILSGMTNGFEKGVHETLSDDAINSIWVRGRTTSMAYRGYQPNRRVRYENKDHDYAKDNIEGIATSSARLSFWNTAVKWGKELSNYGVRSVHPGHQEVEMTKLTSGRYV
ncbi:MAG: ABC transporter permease, partial [Flavobacteriales bacterium]|nr:ABC transporter permease [Flavobacteriales bacterium]